MAIFGAGTLGLETPLDPIIDKDREKKGGGQNTYSLTSSRHFADV